MYNGGKYGEVWRDMQDREFLVVKDNGGVCSTLLLKETPTPYTMQVECGRERYVCPSMLSYVMNAQLVTKTGTAKNMEAVIAAVGEALGLTPRMGEGGGGSCEQEPQADFSAVSRLGKERDQYKAAYDAASKEAGVLRQQNGQLQLYKALYEQLIDRLLPTKLGGV